MKTAVVLGGGGFIGGHLAKRLKSEGYWVRCVDIKPHEYFAHPDICDEFIVGDLRNPNLVKTCLLTPDVVGVDEVYQLAADMGGAGYLFTGENDAGEKITYAEIQTSISDASDGTEGSRLQLGARYNGTFLTYYEAKFGLNTFNRDAIFANDTNIIFEGATNDGNETTLTVADPTSPRIITLPDATGTTVLTSLADADASRGIIAVAAGRFNADGTTVNASNLSCSRTATGNYTLTFGTARPDSNYIITGQIIESTSTKDDVKIHVEEGSQTTTAFNVNIYEGDNIPRDKKSVAINVTLQAIDKTLSENDLDKISKKIIDTVKDKTGAIIRS